MSGHIQKIGFQDGEIVSKGQLLFQLDPRPFQAQIDQALAQAKALEAQQKSLDADVARYTGLVKTKAVTQQQLDQTIADAAYAAAQKDAKLEEVKAHQLDLEYAKITAPISGRIGRALLTEGNYVDANGSDAVLTTIIKLDPIAVYFSMDELARAASHQGYVSLRQKPASGKDFPARPKDRNSLRVGNRRRLSP